MNETPAAAPDDPTYPDAVDPGHDTQSDPASLPLGSFVAGRYRLERLIGEGGFGVVFEASDASAPGVRVALKVVSAKVLEMSGGHDRFRREFELVQRLQHPNIVRVFDSGVDPRGTLYIAFELLHGRSIEDELAARGAFPSQRAGRIAQQVLLGLEAAHAAGVIHRDIKPANVFLVPGPGGSEIVKLIDFGIAKSTNPHTNAAVTAAGTLLGTPAYMAPEQLHGKDIGAAVDVFAFGLVFAEMLMGRSLYGDDANPLAIVRDRISGVPVPIANDVWRTPLARAVEGAVQLDPQKRFRTAAQMRAAVDAALQGGSGGLSIAPSVAPPAYAPLAGSSSSPPTAATEYAWPGTGASGPVGGGSAMTWPSPQAPVLAPPMPYPNAAPFAPGNTELRDPRADAPGTGGPAPWPAPGTSRRASRLPWAAIIVGVLGAAAMASAAIYFATRDDPKPTRKPRRTSDPTSVDVGPTAAPTDPGPTVTVGPTAGPNPGPGPGPGPAPNPGPGPTLTVPGPPPTGPLGVARACSGAAAVTPATLRSHMTAASFPIEGSLLHCSGSMVNFKCLGPEGRGFTTTTSSGQGDATVFKMTSPAEAETFARADATAAREPVTLVYEESTVVRVEMPPADAARLIARICKP